MNAQLTFDEPRARHSDPSTSHEAAAATRRGNAELVGAVRWFVQRQSEPVSAFRIADALAGARWQPDTVRSAVSRSRLVEHKNACKTPGGRLCNGYTLAAS